MYRPAREAAPPGLIRDGQLDRLNELLTRILPANPFYRRKFGVLPPSLSWDDFYALPFTTKTDAAALATYPPGDYVTYHQTSGTTGRPLAILDTDESWAWWAECWQYVYAAAGVTARDRILFAFSFGPFIGFWSAYAAARGLGAMTIPGGGLDSKGRLHLIHNSQATVLMCTPTYALHLAEVAQAEGIAIREGSVRVTIHAGEPGASIPSVRGRIEEAWGARAFDHAGGTEVGAYGFSCEARNGIHLNEAEFIGEVLDPASGEPCVEGAAGELVITNLGRAGWPAIRYRTGDIVTVGTRGCSCGRTFLTFPGGIVGRTDDLVVLRGINVFPSAIEAIVRTFAIEEFRMVRTREGAMEELTVEVEATEEVAASLAQALRDRLAVRIPTRPVPAGSLPRWELKARRLIDRRAP